MHHQVLQGVQLKPICRNLLTGLDKKPIAAFLYSSSHALVCQTRSMKKSKSASCIFVLLSASSQVCHATHAGRMIMGRITCQGQCVFPVHKAFSYQICSFFKVPCLHNQTARCSPCLPVNHNYKTKTTQSATWEASQLMLGQICLLYTSPSPRDQA